MFRISLGRLLWIIVIRPQLFCVAGILTGYAIAQVFQVTGHADRFFFALCCAAPLFIGAMFLDGRYVQKLVHQELQAQDDEWNRLVNAGLDNSEGKSGSN